MKSVYAKAGVNIDQGNKAVKKIKDMVKKLGIKEIGKFSGFFPLKENINNPVLVSSADGVGTKLKVAFMMGKHNTIGKDLVNHCVDDILVYGANPLFFLDYIATGKLKPEVVTSIVSGVLDGCMENEFVLLGGETAEMPGFYQDSEYDVAGFIVGIVAEEKIVDGKNIQPGDLLMGLPSNGLHTNGYSLARHIIFDQLKLKVDSSAEGMSLPIGEELLKVHKSYLKPVAQLVKEDLVKGMAHITGGGFIDNIPRILPDNVSVQIERVWPVPEIFNFLCEQGNISKQERFRVFNMGIGMVLIIDKNNLSKVEEILDNLDETCYLMGQVVAKKSKERIKIN
ncbi:MAG: phosphoribosylformylglycinamidine cyclo-ligase [Candidatus Aminicenantes bacterium]